MAPASIIGKEIVQLCVVVEDVERTASLYREILGFDIPSEYQTLEPYAHTLSTYHGKPADFKAKFVAYSMGNVSFELLQPLSEGSVWMDYLKSHGPGIQHMTFNVPRSAAAWAAMNDHGYPMTQQGLFTGRRGMYSYVETEKDLGVTIEFLEYYDGEPQPQPTPPFPANTGIGTNLICQIGFVVNDRDCAVELYRSVLELPEPSLQQTPGYHITEMTFMGQPSEATAKLAFFPAGQVQLELIEPDETPSVWRNYLNDKGVSAHHIAFQVRDSQKAIDHFAKFGIGVAQQGLYSDRSGVYTYMNTEPQLGIIIELLESFGAPRPR